MHTPAAAPAAKCSELSDRGAREFWAEFFPGHSSVPWNTFAAVLARRFGLSPVQLVRIRRMDREEEEALSQRDFDTFTRVHGLQGALNDMLATTCVICMQVFVNLETGIFCQRTLDGSRTADRDQHFMCKDCLSGHVHNACENGGSFEEHEGSPAGSIPCCLFPQDCDDGALSEGRVLAAVSDEARDRFKKALGRLAVEQHKREESERRRVEEEHARQTDAEEKARLCVGEALTVGQSVRCPGCGNPKRKDDACMHMTCDCGVHFCYVCGADRYPGVRGTGAGYRPENKVNCGCDTPSSYLQLHPGWSDWACPGRGESPGQGALYEFHRRRMAYFVAVVMRLIKPDVWGRLRTRFPELLQDVLPGRSIRWDEVDAAEHPRFGYKVDLPLVRAEEQRLLLRVRDHFPYYQEQQALGAGSGSRAEVESRNQSVPAPMAALVTVQQPSAQVLSPSVAGANSALGAEISFLNRDPVATVGSSATGGAGAPASVVADVSAPAVSAIVSRSFQNRRQSNEVPKGHRRQERHNERADVRQPPPRVLSDEELKAAVRLEPREVEPFRALFQRATGDPRARELPGRLAVTFFSRSGLPAPVLKTVWQICDRNGNGHLTRSEFVLAVRLVGLAQVGVRPSLETLIGFKQPFPIPRFELPENISTDDFDAFVATEGPLDRPALGPTNASSRVDGGGVRVRAKEGNGLAPVSESLVSFSNDQHGVPFTSEPAGVAGTDGSANAHVDGKLGFMTLLALGERDSEGPQSGVQGAVASAPAMAAIVGPSFPAVSSMSSMQAAIKNMDGAGDDAAASALSHYESFYSLPTGSATIDQVQQSSAGVNGWANAGLTDARSRESCNQMGLCQFMEHELQQAFKISAEQDVLRTRLEMRLAESGLMLEEVDRTGHCQFDALARQIARFHHDFPSGRNRDWKEVRRVVAEWLRANPDFPLENNTCISDYLEQEDEYSTWADFCDQIENTSVWGNHITLIAAANVYERPLRIWTTRDATEWWIELFPVNQFSRHARPFELAHLFERHYMSVNDIKIEEDYSTQEQAGASAAVRGQVMGGTRQVPDNQAQEAQVEGSISAPCDIDNVAGIPLAGDCEFPSLDAFYCACRKGELAGVRKYLQEGVNVNAANLAGWTALMLAAYNGHEEIVAVLVAGGAETDLQDSGDYGATALHWAASKGYLRIVEDLLAAGADASLKSKHGRTAHDVAKTDAIKALIDSADARDQGALNDAARRDLLALGKRSSGAPRSETQGLGGAQNSSQVSAASVVTNQRAGVEGAASVPGLRIASVQSLQAAMERSLAGLARERRRD